MHFDTATRQRWMSVLAHSDPQELAARMQTLQLAPQYELIRARKPGWSSCRRAWAASAIDFSPETPP